MNNSDIINGIFEFVGALFSMMNVRRLYKDKSVKGVSIKATAFFTGWGVWNVFFYPMNGLMWSFWGGLLLMCVNLVWVGQMVYYSRKQKPKISYLKTFKATNVSGEWKMEDVLGI